MKKKKEIVILLLPDIFLPRVHIVLMISVPKSDAW